MALVRYLTAATLARSADAGAAVGFVLLAETTPGLDRPGLVGALLVSSLMAPHLLGPVLGRWLDRAQDGRRLIAAVTTVYGVLIAAAALALGHVPLPLVIVMVAVAGAGGPLLTGGLSSRLGGLVADTEHAQRRAQGLDSLSYGIGGTAGAAVVAALASLTNARVSMLVLGAGTLVAAALVLTLPARPNQVTADRVLPLRAALQLFTAPGPLRRVMAAMLLAAFPSGGAAVVAVAMAGSLDVTAETAGLLSAGFGLGYLLGSLALIARPLRGEPERLVVITVSVVAAGYVLCALAPGYAWAMLAFGLLGAVNAPYFTATLAARAQYSPPEARAQVFVTMGALKIASASGGAAVTGLAIGLGPRVLLVVSGLMTLAGAVVMLLDQAASARRVADRTR